MSWLPFILKILSFFLDLLKERQRKGLLKEGEQRLLAKQMVAYANELSLWNDISEEIRTMSDDDLRNILTGRVSARPSEASNPNKK